jgi:diguanylate cyclase (GGDEF)-like protein
MTWSVLLIPLVLFFSFLLKTKKIFILSGVVCLTVLFFCRDKAGIAYPLYYWMFVSIVFYLPFLVRQANTMSSTIATEMDNGLSVLESRLKDIKERNILLQNKIQYLERQNAAVSDLYEMTKDMTTALHFSEIFKVFQGILIKNFSFHRGFLITLRSDSTDLEIDKIYQISPVLSEELKETYLPHQAYYKLVEHCYSFKESAFVDTDSSLGKQSGLTTPETLAVSILKIENKIIGAILLEGLAKEDYEEFSIFSTQFSLELRKVTLYEQVEKLATTDSVTGLCVRRKFLELAREELIRAKRHQMNLSVLMLDIDHFKFLNDTYGHLSGDYILKEIARILKTNLREIDLLGRYGGEEFSVVLPDTDLESTKIVVGRLGQSVRNYNFKTFEEQFKVTLSIGVAGFPKDGEELIRLIDAADKALYTAKERGRDCSVFYREINS